MAPGTTHWGKGFFLFIILPETYVSALQSEPSRETEPIGCKGDLLQRIDSHNYGTEKFYDLLSASWVAGKVAYIF